MIKTSVCKVRLKKDQRTADRETRFQAPKEGQSSHSRLRSKEAAVSRGQQSSLSGVPSLRLVWKDLISEPGMASLAEAIDIKTIAVYAGQFLCRHVPTRGGAPGLILFGGIAGRAQVLR